MRIARKCQIKKKKKRKASRFCLIGKELPMTLLIIYIAKTIGMYHVFFDFYQVLLISTPIIATSD